MDTDQYVFKISRPKDGLILEAAFEIIRQFVKDRPDPLIKSDGDIFVIEGKGKKLDDIANLTLLVIGYAKLLESFIDDVRDFMQKLAYAVFRIILPNAFGKDMVDSDILIGVGKDGLVFAITSDKKIDQVNLTIALEIFYERFGDLPDAEDFLFEKNDEFTDLLNKAIYDIAELIGYEDRDSGFEVLHP